ncbi:MAG: outer membrane protein assembly factor, partial [Sphingobacteriales bacterium]
MQRIFYQNALLVFAFLFTGFQLSAQVSSDTTPVSVNPALQEIFSSKYPKEYTIGGITVTGSRSFDQNLIVSISGLAVGDKIQLPGTDVFGKAITKLWKQSLVSNVSINLTRLEGTLLFIELNVTERPRLLDFRFVGVKKGERDDLETKVQLAKDRVISENMKLTAVEAIIKFYSGKGFRNVKVDMKEEPVPGVANSVRLTFYIDKGKKVRINSINFTDNYSVQDQRLKKQMKGTKEMTKITLFPQKIVSPYGDSSLKTQRFKDYLKEYGYLTPTKTKDVIEPYFRFKLFSSSKFNETKYADDKESILNFYNARGFRDATLVADTQFYDTKGNLNIDIKVKEGRRYYFGDIVWKGNTKYSDSLLNQVL